MRHCNFIDLFTFWIVDILVVLILIWLILPAHRFYFDAKRQKTIESDFVFTINKQ